MSALLKLFGFTPSALIIDLIYAGIVAGILGGVGLWIHHCHNAENELKSINAQSKVNLDAANARIEKLTTDHAAEVLENERATQLQLATNAVTHAADLVRVRERVRQLEAYREGHPDVARPAPNTEAGSGGGRSAGESPSGFGGLGDVAASLADATRDLSVALNSCTVDRDSLTGKP